MKNITVEKSKLLERLAENQKKHIIEYSDTKIKYLKRLKEKLEEMLKKIEMDIIPETFIRLPEPENHQEDYSRVMAMLEMDINKTVMLDEQEYRQYVNNEWGWRESFNQTRTFYAGR